MTQVYNGRKYQIYSAVPIPKSCRKTEKGYVYFISLVFSNGAVWRKIGITNDIIERMKQHAADYAKRDKWENYGIPGIYIHWISNPYSIYTAQRVEKKMIKKWCEECPDWEYMANDRFVIPDTVTEIKIVVRKEWSFSLT